MRALLAVIGSLALVAAAPAKDFGSERIHGFGSKGNRINVVFLGDGWTKAELPKYKDAVKKLKDGMLEADPLKQYANFMTITRVDVESPESGITHEYVWLGEYGPTGGTTDSRAGTPGFTGTTSPTAFADQLKGKTIVAGSPATFHETDTNRFYRRGPVVNTYFQSWFWASRRDADDSVANPQRSVWLKDDFSDGTKNERFRIDKMMAKIADTNKSLPRTVVILVLNDDKHGGAALEGNPGVICLTNAASSIPVLQHEMGHALMVLDDEYIETGNEPTDPLPSEAELNANVTRESDKTKVKWKHWVGVRGEDIDKPIEGARYRSKGLFRPKDNCMMNTSGTPFCAVCREEGVRRMLTRVSLIDAVKPSARAISITKGESYSFKVHSVGPKENKIEANWFIDGKTVKGTKTNTGQGPVFECTMGPAQLVPGKHTIKCVVNDKTPLVRDAKEGEAEYKRRPNQRFWYVTVVDPARLPTLSRDGTGGTGGQ